MQRQKDYRVLSAQELDSEIESLAIEATAQEKIASQTNWRTHEQAKAMASRYWFMRDMAVKERERRVVQTD